MLAFIATMLPRVAVLGAGTPPTRAPDSS
jgi:hypothetical protein